ncbi:MAG: Phosphoesterase, PA-phosphatase related protein [Gammaproteobacteria bacterium]|nr:Phosphoesterase, PA-phosphatase related protein [Gammaproteobacteria bacterium]
MFIRRFVQLGMLVIAGGAHADVVADWAERTTEIATDGPNTIRTMALAESAVYEAVNAITSRYPRDRADLGQAQGASIEAATAAASRAVMLHEAPALSKQIDAAYTKAISVIPDDAARARGIGLGERAAADVIGKHTDDIGDIEPYRPLTSPGVYVPTTFPLGYAVAQYRPWFLKSAAQFRPGPPPALKSALWAKDYNEIKTMGSATSTVRTLEQTAIARFWATALPDVHMGVVHSVARSPGREVTRNARLYAAVTAALNDTEISVFEAKYHYQFWRPITAIRNGDRDDNAATERDAGWTPLIVTPIQPEYPCAHCMIAATIAAMIRADIGREPMPTLKTTSNTAPGVTRQWTRTEDLVQEVSNGRMWDGVHYRNSTEVGNRMGEQVAAVVTAAYGLTR